MAKFELVKTTELDGGIWYHINKDGFHVNQSYTRKLVDAERMFEELVNGKPSTPIEEIIKTTENADN